MPTLEPRRGTEPKHFLRQKRSMRRETEDPEIEKKNCMRENDENPTKYAEQEMRDIHDREAFFFFNLSSRLDREI